MNLQAMNLTTLEAQALNHLQPESSANGHDFGLLENVEWPGTRKQLGGLITSLKAKGVITDIGKVEVDGKTWTQYVLAEEVRA